MKKIIFLILFIFSLNILVACTNKPSHNETLVVGVHNIDPNFTPYNSDIYVSELVHGYSTTIKDENGEYLWDTTVLAKNPQTKFNDEGTKTYQFTIKKDLLWNNGEQITAKDYLATLLIYSSQAWNENSMIGYDLIGYHDYHNKETFEADYPVFSGVRLIDDFNFSLTIKSPDYYDITNVNLKPIYLSSYLPGYDIKDDGAGAYLIPIETSKDISKLLKETVFSNNGEKINPKVTCGPYNFIEYQNNVVTLELNSYYKGNYQGKLPTIKTIQIKEINSLTDLEQVIAGSVDLICSVNDPNKITVANDTSKVGVNKYLENGFRYIGIHNDYKPTNYPEVRRALAFLIDRNKLLNKDINGNGEVINGPFPKDNWFYQESKAELESSLVIYSQNINNANLELNSSPYRYEEDGKTLYNPEKADRNYFRHDAEGNPLEIKHCVTKTSTLPLELTNIAWKAGIKYQYDELPNEDFFDNIGKRTYHLYELSIKFEDYNPYHLWHTSSIGTDNNPLFVNDLFINNALTNMKNAETKVEFNNEFMILAKRWNRILPSIPLYSCELYDIYNKKVKGLKTNAHWNWANDICDIYIE